MYLNFNSNNYTSTKAGFVKKSLLKEKYNFIKSTNKNTENSGIFEILQSNNYSNTFFKKHSTPTLQVTNKEEKSLT